MRTKAYYHGTDAKGFDPREDNSVAGRYDLCLAEDLEVAEAYAADYAEHDTVRLYSNEAIVGFEKIA